MIDLNLLYNKSNLKWLAERTLYVTKHGSLAYGTNTPESDIDLRGICVATKEHYLGILNSFEQAQFTEPYDATIFDLRKFVKLALDFNPNAVEIIFTDPSDILVFKPEIQPLFDIRDRFISKKCKYTMTGYASSQIKRILRHRRYLQSPPTNKPERVDFGLPSDRTLIPHHQLLEIEAEVEKVLTKWTIDTTGLPNDVAIDIKNKMYEIFVDLKINQDEFHMYAARYLGLDDNLLDAFRKEKKYRTAKKEWDHYQVWLKERNPKRAKIEEKYGFDCIHGSHLVRLFRMCEEVLTTGKLIVKRPDAEELLAIKNGAWSYEKLMTFAEEQEKLMNELYTKSSLPREPDRNAVNDVCIKIIESML